MQQTWVGVFVAVAAVAIVLQTLLVLAFIILFARMSRTLMRISVSVESQVSPVMNRMRALLEESRTDMRDILHGTAEVVETVQANSRRFDRVLEEATERLRQQIIHADRMLTGAMDSVEDAGKELQKSLVEPIRTATALFHGVRAGIEFFRGRSRMPERRREAEDEGLFI